MFLTIIINMCSLLPLEELGIHLRVLKILLKVKHGHRKMRIFFEKLWLILIIDIANVSTFVGKQIHAV